MLIKLFNSFGLPVYNINRLFVANLNSGEKVDCTASFDQNVKGLTWTADAKSIYFISDIIYR